MTPKGEERPTADPQATAVVYEPGGGTIVSWHHFTALPGLDLPAREEMEAMALRCACRGGEQEAQGAAGLAVMMTASPAREKGVDYRVSRSRLVPSRPAGRPGDALPRLSI
jgi:hypothetical protein